MIEIIKLILQLVKANPVLWIALIFIALLAYGLSYVFTAWVGSMRTPTDQDTEEYRQRFRFWNKLAGMVQRARSTAIEQSPNFIPAAEKYVFIRYGIDLQKHPAVVTDWQLPKQS